MKLKQSTTPKKPTATPKDMFRVLLTGFGMGMADLVPGVSGGTIAFIFGIYEELIHSIKTVTGQALKLLLQFKIMDAFKIIPFKFLIPLAVGVGTAILSLSHALTWALANYPVYIWSFFFGLVLISTVIVARRVVVWDVQDIGAAIISAVATYWLVGAVPVETPNNLLWMFGSGAIAIIAMILPGISGSFILVILGKYAQVLEAVNNRDILTLGVFMIGCAVGIALFSRVLSWLFDHHHDITIAILTGFLVGSLRKIWPWKETLLTRVNSHGEVVPVVERNIVPVWGTEVLIAIGLCLFGIGLMMFFEKLQATKEHLADVEDPELLKEHAEAIKSQKHTDPLKD